MTIERNVPGYRYDKHSTVYILIQANPLIVNDALKLLSRFGPQYEYPPIATATILEDFRALPFDFDNETRPARPSRGIPERMRRPIGNSHCGANACMLEQTAV